jgi:photosystem II stability/assembly factor-like uncharacterized protein
MRRVRATHLRRALTGGLLGLGLLYFFLIPPSVGGAISLRGPELRHYLYVFFSDPSTGWLSDGAELIHTQDGGRTWRILAGPFGPDTVLAVKNVVTPTVFPPATILFAERQRAVLHATRDGGRTWTMAALNYWKRGLPTSLGSLQFVSPTEGWAREADGQTLWRTRWAGERWEPLPPVPGGAGTVLKFFFLDSSRGWVLRTVPATAGDDLRVLGTANGGHAWVETGVVAVPFERMIHRLWFRDPLTGWILESGLGAQLHSTTDGGQTWRRYSFGIDPAAHEVAHVHFLDRLQGWAVTNAAGGQPGLILRTTDGGQTWQPVPHPARVGNLNGVWFLTPTEGWVVGDSSTILKTTDGGQTWTAIEDDLRVARRTSPLRRAWERLLGR